MFICNSCKVELPTGQKFTRHGFPESRELCGECFTKWGNYNSYIEEKYQIPTIKEYFKN